MDLRELRLEETDGEKEFEDTRKIVNFLSRLRWSTQANPQGGITWLELFVWFRLHKFEKASSFLKPKSSLQSQMAVFKKRVRNIKRHCVGTGDEWLLDTCYGRGNRLKEAGVANKHAAAQGLPRIPEGDAQRIMEVIQKMRGSVNTKQK